MLDTSLPAICADAMKREAGVTEQTVHENKEDLSGLAYICAGGVQLDTLAHECGHIVGRQGVVAPS
jgi:hypothetical protein